LGEIEQPIMHTQTTTIFPGVIVPVACTSAPRIGCLLSAALFSVAEAESQRDIALAAAARLRHVGKDEWTR